MQDTQYVGTLLAASYVEKLGGTPCFSTIITVPAGYIYVCMFSLKSFISRQQLFNSMMSEIN